MESAENIQYIDNESLYITALPLHALLLPYTVKLAGGKPITNAELTVSYSLPNNQYHIKLLQRYNYVYSTPSPHIAQIESSGVIPRMLRAVKENNFTAARLCMTPDLSSSIDDSSLTDFFSEYIDIIENNYLPGLPNSYFLIDKNNKGHLFNFTLKSNLIDNMIEANS